MSDKLSVELRRGPSTEYLIMRNLDAGAAVEVLEQNGEGYSRVRVGEPRHRGMGAHAIPGDGDRAPATGSLWRSAARTTRRRVWPTSSAKSRARLRAWRHEDRARADAREPRPGEPGARRASRPRPPTSSRSAIRTRACARSSSTANARSSSLTAENARAVRPQQSELVHRRRGGVARRNRDRSHRAEPTPQAALGLVENGLRVAGFQTVYPACSSTASSFPNASIGPAVSPG